MFGLTNRRERAAAAWLARMENEGAQFDRAEFERWRARHPANARAFDEALGVWKLDLPVGATSYATDRNDRSVSGDRAERLEPRSRRSAYMALATVFLAIAAGVGLERAGLIRSSESHSATQVANTVSTGPKQVRAFRLSDGSIVTLGEESELTIAFSNRVRDLTLLRGRARFDVAHDSKRPFEVYAGHGVVTAHGTVFDVHITAQGAQVSLLRGAIDIERMERKQRTGDVRKLAPGQVLTVPAQGSLGAPETVKPTETANGSMLTFDNAPVSEAIKAMNQRNARKIVIEGSRLQTETVSGGFHVGDPDGFAQLIASMFDLSLSTDAGGNLLLKAKP